VYFVGLYCVIM